MKRDPSPTEGTPGLADQFKDERTEKKIQEHLNNENDIITEEDIANAPVGPVNRPTEDEFAEGTVTEISGEGTTENADPKVKGTEDPGIETTWNVLEP
ncbi:MAG: hypothetical protein EOO06_10775 [Chitinophagaceae bacterium]|nr:MAG: hypothetical protein EOO06_10775 [Chitinophagaceae bacterium]